MLSYIHFTHDERISLHIFLKEGLSIREIARRLGRSPSTISREVKRNSSSKGYHHWRAQILTICRRRHQHRTALKPDAPQYHYTLEKLKATRRGGQSASDIGNRKYCAVTVTDCRLRPHYDSAWHIRFPPRLRNRADAIDISVKF